MKMHRLVAASCLMLITSTSAFAQEKVQERRAAVPNGFVRIFAFDGAFNVLNSEF